MKINMTHGEVEELEELNRRYREGAIIGQASVDRWLELCRKHRAMKAERRVAKIEKEFMELVREHAYFLGHESFQEKATELVEELEAADASAAQATVELEDFLNSTGKKS